MLTKLTRHSVGLRDWHLHKRLLSTFVLSVLIALTLAGCGCSSTLTILSITEGNVSVMKAGTESWTEAQHGMSLEAGDRIKTDDNSSAEITFSEGSTIELQAGTEIEIASLDIPTGTGSATIILEQTIGSVIFRVKRIVDPASRYEVETPTGVVAVRGSVVQVYVIEDGTTWATNLEGDIWAVAQGVELQVPQGRQCVIRPDQPPELTITFAIAGPMTESQGEHQWWGAELARDEINADAGVNVGGVYHKIALVQVNTNETLGTAEEGVTALQAVIDDVDFVLGGFSTEYVVAYREVAIDAKKIFMGCGASMGVLQYSVVDDYDRYKYWFKGTPYNETFLVKSLYKMMITISGLLKDELVAMGPDVKDDYEVTAEDKLNVAIVMENVAWADAMVSAAQLYLPVLGFGVVGTWRPSPTATDISTELTQIAAAKPHIIFTGFSGPVGSTYSRQRAELAIPALSLGINVKAQRKGHWTDTEGKCNGEIILDTWAEGLQNTAKTTAFFDAFVAKTGEYPIYTAATYDAIYQLKSAIEATDSLDTDDIIPYLETHSYTGQGGTTAYYPMPAIDLGGGVYALSEEQVRALYPTLGTYNEDDWKCGPSDSTGPHIVHDLVYGPGYVTGIGSQWQDGHKVGVWPIDFGDEYDETFTDQYGCWNFEYPGTVDVVIPIEGFLGS